MNAYLPLILVSDPQKPSVYEPDCFICNDPDYAAYGLPLCFRCPVCGCHVSADDDFCANCG